MARLKDELGDAPKKYAVPAVDALLDILEYMGDGNRQCGVTELSKALGVSNNLAFRIMRRLSARGYADASAGGLYKLGSGFFSLGMKLSRSFDLRLRARPRLEELAKKVGATCQLQVLEGDAMLVLDVIAPDAPFFIQVVPGTKLNCHCNAFGKAVLAFRSEDFVKALIPARLPALTPRSLTDRAAFLKELETTRKTGVAYDREEYNLGFICVGAPVFDVNGDAVAGLGMTALASVFEKARGAEFEKAVVSCAQAVSREIGYQGDFFTRLGL
jgi:IclR family acetate operon transcriptional repressor